MSDERPQMFPGVTPQISKAIEDLMVTTETLGYVKGKRDTLKRVEQALLGTAEAFKEANDAYSQNAVLAAIKVVLAIYVPQSE
jgi:hypothetical protein